MKPFGPLTVAEIYFPKRLDAYLTEALGDAFSREEVKRAIRAGRVLLNGKKTQAKTRLKKGDVLSWGVDYPRQKMRFNHSSFFGVPWKKALVQKK